MTNKVIVGLLVVLAVGLAFLILQRPAENNVSFSPTPSPVFSPSPSPQSSVLEISVSGGDFFFSPSTITARAGQRIRITFTNEGTKPHNLAIGSIAQSRTINPGQSDVFEFVAPAPGDYRFVCSVPTHEQKGMVGLLKVQ